MFFVFVFVPLAATAALILGRLRGQGVGGPDLGGSGSGASRRWWVLLAAVGLLAALGSGYAEIAGRPHDVEAGAAFEGVLLGVGVGAAIVALYAAIGILVGFVTEEAKPAAGWVAIVVVWMLLAIPAYIGLFFLGIAVADSTRCAADAYECPL